MDTGILPVPFTTLPMLVTFGKLVISLVNDGPNFANGCCLELINRHS